MQWRPKSLFRWEKPSRVRAAEFRAEMVALRPVLFRLPVLVATVLFVCWYLIRRFLPDLDFPIENFAVALGLLVLVIGINVITTRYLPTQYELRDASISWNSGQHTQVIRWKDVVAGSIQSHPLVEGVQIVKLQLKGSRSRVITLPEDDSAAKILTAIQERIPSFVAPGGLVEVKRWQPLTIGDQIFLAGITFLYIYAIGMFFWHLLPSKHGAALVEGFLLGTFILGPGSIGCAVLAGFRWARFRQLLPYAGLVNMIACLLTMVVLAGIVHRRSMQRPSEPKRTTHTLSRKYSMA